jgi:hypothetical protein
MAVIEVGKPDGDRGAREITRRVRTGILPFTEVIWDHIEKVLEGTDSGREHVQRNARDPQPS